MLLGIGGTSISAQVFAGVMALINQYQATHGHSGRQGNANPVLYQLAAQPNASCNSSTAPLGSSSCIFYDTTKGNISADCMLTAPNCGGPGPFTGVLVDPNNPNTPAWTTTAGFDLATGLGSVNVQNLAASWSGMAFTPTVTNLSASPTSITHGQTVTVNVTVSPNGGSGTPSGDVSLIANTGGSGQAVGVFSLTGGAIANQTTTSLPGGSYNLVAHYAGDGTYAASDSNAVAVNVTPEPSKTFLSLVTFDPITGQLTNSNASSTPYGSPYILRIDVGNASVSATNLCAEANLLGCPTGSVHLTSDGAQLDAGSYALNSKGFTEDFAIQLSGGQHTLQAAYSGDNSYQASTGSSTVTITPAATSVSGSSNFSNVLVGQSVAVSVSVSARSNGAVPTGSVSLFEDAGQNPVGTAVLSPSSTSDNNFRAAQANVNVTLTTSGFHSFSVQYSGDQNYAPSSGFSTSIDAQYQPTITLSASPQNVTYPGTTTVTAILHTGRTSPQPSIAMSLSGVLGTNVNAPTYANITDPDGTDALQLTQTYEPLVSSDVTATFFGDLNYRTATSAAYHIAVTGAPDFSLSTSSANLSLTHGQSATTTLTVTDLNGFNGPVSFSCGVQGSAPLSCTVSPNPVTTAAGSTTATATVTITSLSVASLGHRTILEVFSFVFAGLILATRPQKRRLQPMRAMAILVLLSLPSISCGGGGSGSGGTPPPPPPQTSTVTVTGSASLMNQVAVSHTATISVTVQ